ncbi:MAG: autotransporter domain-containing protein [Methylobacteriaceae bacterium]|nr:autotransporter domain-containing protein [Methylobacteriaceae bacterium]
MVRTATRTALFALMTAASLSSAAAQSRLVVFGDSLSDNGNLAIATGNAQPGYPSLRFSNGLVWAEQLVGPLANFFPVGPVNNARSVDFAFGGARTDTAVANPPGVPTQVGAYFARGGAFGSNDVVSVWAGANDLFQAIPGAGANPATAQAVMSGVATGAAANVAAQVSALAGAGASTIVVMNLPDIGVAPAFSPTPAAPLATFSSLTFNGALSAGLANVAAARAGANIISVDIASVFDQIRLNPAAFGFANVTQACVAVAACVGGSLATQNSYLFWDGVHPTTAGHALVAQAVRQYLFAPQLSAYSATLAEIALNGRRSEALRGFDRLRDHAAAPGVNSYFVNVFGDIGESKTAAQRSAFDWRVGGVQLGMTRAITNAYTIGLIGSVSTGSVKAGPNNVVSYDATTFALDVLAGWKSNGFFGNVGLGAGFSRMSDWERKTFVGPLTNKADASGLALSATLEGGYEARFGAFALTPMARLGFLRAQSDSFEESGVVAPIAYARRTIDAVSGAVELRAGFDIMRETSRSLSAYALVGYEDFLSYSGGAVRGRLVGNTARPFSTRIGDMTGEGLLLGGGLSGAFGAVKISADYRASLGKGDGVRHRGAIAASFAF